MIMNKWIRLNLVVSSVLLTGVSVVFSVLLWAGLPDRIWLSVVTGAAGFALELCKFSLLPFSFLLFQRRKTGQGVLLLLLGGGLFVVSIGASIAFLEAGEQQRALDSDAWHQRQATIEQLDKRIALGQLSARQDVDNGYRQRAAATLEKVDQIQEKRGRLLTEPVEFSGVVGVSDSLLTLSGEYRWFAWLLLALLIDGCSIAGWTLLASHAKVESDCRDDSHCQESAQVINKENKGINMISSEVSVDEAVLNRIVSGVYGQKITIRGVMEKERLGYRRIKPVFESLENKGVLIGSNRGYQLNLNGECYVPGETDRLL